MAAELICCEKGCDRQCSPRSRVRCAEHYQEPRYEGHLPLSSVEQRKVDRKRQAAQDRLQRRAAGLPPTRVRQIATRPELECTRDGCLAPIKARGLCGRHYEAQRHDRSVKHYRDGLPRGYWSDASIYAAGHGAVVVCELCGSKLGPINAPAAAAMAVHEHSLRAHIRGEAWRHGAR